jgi:hypothetical protein
LAIAIGALTIAACGGAGDGTSGPSATEGHRVAVAISGLMGSGTVVQLNGANDQQPLPTNTALYFTNIAKGTQFTIAIKAQPTNPWQTCVIANGTGTMGSSDMAGATMTCTINTYKVRGTVSGLTAGGLTLSIGTGAPLAVASGATTFEFAGVASNTTFSVTIASQPTGQTCALNNGANTVTNADITNLTLTCGPSGFTVGGTASGLGSDGLTLSLNGGASLSIAGTAASFTFPNVLQTGDEYGIVVTANPQNSGGSSFRQTCVLAQGRGKIATSNVSNVSVICRANGSLAGFDGVYAIDQGGGKRSFLMLLADGTYSFASRTEDSTCPQNGNGAEYGVYSRTSDGTFSVRMAATDRNGGCGVWDPSASPPVGLSGKMTRNGDALSITTTDGTFGLTAVSSVATSLVGAFIRADGVDGSFVVFEPDGTYLYQEAQDAIALSITSGYERGCYTVTGGTFTTSLAASCKPNGLPALDLNNRGGFSSLNGAPIPFTIDSPTSVTINGRKYRRLLPGG